MILTAKKNREQILTCPRFISLYDWSWSYQADLEANKAKKVEEVSLFKIPFFQHHYLRLLIEDIGK